MSGAEIAVNAAFREASYARQAEPCAVDDPKFYALMAGRGVQVRNGLAAGGSRIRTLGPREKEPLN
jgi:hypothetical protein